MKESAILTREIRQLLAAFKAILAAASIVSVDVAAHRAATLVDFAVVDGKRVLNPAMAFVARQE